MTNNQLLQPNWHTERRRGHRRNAGSQAAGWNWSQGKETSEPQPNHILVLFKGGSENVRTPQTAWDSKSNTEFVMQA